MQYPASGRSKTASAPGSDSSVQRRSASDWARPPAHVTVLQPPFNLGHQRALVYALRKALPQIADEDAVVTLDADGEDRPEDLPRLLGLPTT